LLIIEPIRRNTAAAIALAALAIDPAQLMLVMPSDHLIADVPAFLDACRSATPLAQAGRLITFGIRPERAEPGFGYIKRGAPLTDRAFSVARFVEKPDRATASRYLQSGNYDWNAGIFLFTAKSYLEELGHWSPDILQAAVEAMNRADTKGQVVRPARKQLARCKGGSIDKAVLEHSDLVAVLPVEIGWSDIGTYDALYETGEHDENSNVMHGPSLTLDTQGCLIRSEGPLITAIGVHDLIVIATADVVLIAKRGASGRVPELVTQIEENAPNLL
jgi:mannose-1-phosphate guanylyltransferase/mannose-1-phosphate guanylyltransferase/mannose-6-phosphate isomerase